MGSLQSTIWKHHSAMGGHYGMKEKLKKIAFLFYWSPLEGDFIQRNSQHEVYARYKLEKVPLLFFYIHWQSLTNLGMA